MTTECTTYRLICLDQSTLGRSHGSKAMIEAILTKIQTNFDDHDYYNNALVGEYRQHV